MAKMKKRPDESKKCAGECDRDATLPSCSYCNGGQMKRFLSFSTSILIQPTFKLEFI